MAQIRKYDKGVELVKIASLDSEVQEAYQNADEATRAAMDALAGTYRNYVATGEIGSRDTRRLLIDLNKRLLAISRGEAAYNPLSINTATYNIFGYLSSRDRDNTGLSDEVENLGNQLALLTFLGNTARNYYNTYSNVLYSPGASGYTPGGYEQILGMTVNPPSNYKSKNIELNINKYLTTPREKANITPSRFAEGLYNVLQLYSLYSSLPEYLVTGDIATQLTNSSDFSNILSTLQDIKDEKFSDEEAKTKLDGIISTYFPSAQGAYSSWFSPSPQNSESVTTENPTLEEGAPETENQVSDGVESGAEEEQSALPGSSAASSEVQTTSRPLPEITYTSEKILELAKKEKLERTATDWLRFNFDIGDIYEHAKKGDLGEQLGTDNSKVFEDVNVEIGKRIQDLFKSDVDGGSIPDDFATALLNFVKKYSLVLEGIVNNTVNKDDYLLRTATNPEEWISIPAQIMKFCERSDIKNSLISLLKSSEDFSPEEKEFIEDALNVKTTPKAKQGMKLVRFLSAEEVQTFKKGGKAENEDIITTSAGLADISGATKGLSSEAKAYLRQLMEKDLSTAGNLKEKDLGVIENAATNSAYRHRLEALGADIIGMFASFFPGVGLAIGVGSGLTATVLNAIADHESGASWGEIAKNAAIGVATSAVTVVAPAIAAAKIGPKLAAFLKMAIPLGLGGSAVKAKIEEKGKVWSDPNHQWTKEDAMDLIQTIGLIVGSIGGSAQAHHINKAQLSTAATKPVKVTANGELKVLNLYTNERKQLAKQLKNNKDQAPENAVAALKDILKNRKDKKSQDLAKENFTVDIEDIVPASDSKWSFNRGLKRFASRKDATASPLKPAGVLVDLMNFSKATSNNAAIRLTLPKWYVNWQNGLDSQGNIRNSVLGRVFNFDLPQLPSGMFNWMKWIYKGPYKGLQWVVGANPNAVRAAQGGRLNRLLNYVNNTLYGTSK